MASGGRACLPHTSSLSQEEGTNFSSSQRRGAEKVTLNPWLGRGLRVRRGQEEWLWAVLFSVGLGSAIKWDFGPIALPPPPPRKLAADDTQTTCGKTSLKSLTQKSERKVEKLN